MKIREPSRLPVTAIISYLQPMCDIALKNTGVSNYKSSSALKGN